MAVIPVDYEELLEKIKSDNSPKRFNAQVFLVNNISVYFRLINELKTMADLTVAISDETICAGPDTLPDIKKVINILNDNNDKNILVTSIGEYLRLGFIVEDSNRCLFSLLSRQAHSSKRVWIPIYAAKDEFISVVGDLDDEHYPQMIYEIEGMPSGFELTVYSDTFSKINEPSKVKGIRNWLEQWDNQKIISGLSLITRHAKQIKESDGLFTIKVISKPLNYFMTMVKADSEVDFSIGSEEKWIALTEYSKKPGSPIKEVIKTALNVIDFDPISILSGWNTLDELSRWCFWIWYRLKLNDKSDYFSFAVNFASSCDSIPKSLEMSILYAIDNPNFEDWVQQRKTILEAIGVTKFSESFWAKFDEIDNCRKQLKILTGLSHEERTKIIEIVSKALSQGGSISDFKMILLEKCPDLVYYLQESNYGYDDLKEYISNYKYYKIKDEVSLEMSKMAGDINPFDYDTRSKILSEIKKVSDSYYLWIDGMGVEWIDLLIRKIASKDAGFSNPEVEIGTAVLPSVTSVNMSCADPETVSKKLNSLDSLGHIKDKSDCNYFSIIAKQFELISQIAQDVVRISEENPTKDIVITSDHGMSRMVAKGFHTWQGVNPRHDAEVCSLGRYCSFAEGAPLPDVSNTLKKDNVVAFKTYGHFTASGYAPGENHGGATPEELLVPIIRYRRKKGCAILHNSNCSYSINHTVEISSSGICELTIQVQGFVERVTVEINSTRIEAKKKADSEWIASIPGLKTNFDYQLSIYLNNLYSQKKESLYVKSAGLDIDDDF